MGLFCFGAKLPKLEGRTFKNDPVDHFSEQPECRGGNIGGRPYSLFAIFDMNIKPLQFYGISVIITPPADVTDR
jgi:hypothetical protein